MADRTICRHRTCGLGLDRLAGTAHRKAPGALDLGAHEHLHGIHCARANLAVDRTHGHGLAAVKRPLAVAGLVVACAACCALPFLLPAIGLSVFGGGLLFGFRWDQVLCAVAAVAAAVLARALWTPKPKGCATDGSCGCKPAE